ncbi:MAG: hypothetical protein GY679_02135 [Mycoplasma sp.]|nr:hypothetical protein [Mycoplasma sp.]
MSVEYEAIGGYGYYFDEKEVDEALSKYCIYTGIIRPKEVSTMFNEIVDGVEWNDFPRDKDFIWEKHQNCWVKNGFEGVFFGTQKDINIDFRSLDRYLRSLCFDVDKKKKEIFVGLRVF